MKLLCYISLVVLTNQTEVVNTILTLKHTSHEVGHLPEYCAHKVRCKGSYSTEKEEKGGRERKERKGKRGRVREGKE